MFVTWLRLLAVGLVVTACAGVPGSDPAPAAADSQSLQAVIDEYVARQRAGRGGRDLSADAFETRIQEDRDLLDRTRAVEPFALSRPEQIDRVALIGVLESEVRLAETRRIWENDPGLYVPAGRIGRALERLRLNEDGAADRVATALESVPAGIAAGIVNLGRPPRRFAEAALYQLEATLTSLRDDAELIAAAGAGPAAARDQAVAALERYEQHLRDEVMPRADGDWTLGKASYDYVLQHRWFLQEDADSIRQRGLDAFEQIETQALEVARRIDPDADSWVEVYERLKDEHPDPDAVKQGYQSQMDAAQVFVIDHALVTLPAGEQVITVDTPPAMRRSSPFGTFDSVDPFGTELQGRLVLTPIEEDWPEEQKRERLRSHHTAWLPIIAVHEAYPGHHVHALKVRENPRLLRRVMHEPITFEGWGLFTERLLFEEGFLQGDDVELTMLRNRLWRAARVILDSSLHTGRMSIEDAVDFLSERVRFERYAAELEVGMIPQRPTYVLGYLIGMQEIDRLRHDWIADNGEPEPPAELWDAFLTAGGIPPALIRAELLGEEIPAR